ncbi:glycosyltransferase family 4 protein [Sphingobium baderi]|uniref:glycosyltransferase family 4 protein n=1 Tax=Sphingobium baderi TaxID=1332080 RepID=UPI002B406281|nr:glycosyltransferase family 4 protein [Sphingobium baderi]WRD75399.1 glycosyltransferase family 4 protein [Sphingobium baderi]
MKILVLSSFAFSLVNFRGRLIEAMVREGHQVVTCAPDSDRAVETQLAALGASYRRIAMARTGSNPLADLMLLLRYVRLIARERPDVVLAYTQKPIIYGGIAARLFRGVRFYALMSGLGYVFSPAADHRRLLRAVVARLYRLAVARARAIFVFNGDDRDELIAQGIVDMSAPVMEVPGSGVDLAHFAHASLPKGPPVFLMISRLMRDKGVFEYAEAARRLKARYPQARFQLLGRLDRDNPTGLPEAELDLWVRQGIIDYVPETRDVRPLLTGSTVFVLPSYYREGLPRTLLEAMSVGRPLVTTDLPGCREPVMPGVNGFLVPPRDVDALCEAMEHFLDDPALAAAMGARSRAYAEERFDVDKVNRQLLRVMDIGGGESEVTEPSPAMSWSAG